MALISQAIINGQMGNPYQYSNNESMNQRRSDAYSVISSNRSALSKTNKPFKVRKPNDYLYSNKPYTESELKFKVGKLDKAIQDGWVYYFDTETIGQPSSMFNEMISNTSIPAEEQKILKNLNSKNHVMTELYMNRQRYEGGVPVGDAERVISVTNTRDYHSMSRFNQDIRDSKYGGLFKFNQERFAGLGGPGSYVPGEKSPRLFNPNANIDDANLIEKGMRNISKNSMFEVGTKEFENEAQRIYNLMGEIASNTKENSVFVSLNGDNFDLPVLEEYWSQGHVKRNKKFDSAIKNAHLDEQKAIAQTSKDIIYKDINAVKTNLKSQFEEAYKNGDMDLGAKLEDQYNSIVENDLRITNESIGIAAQNRGYEKPDTQFHVASEDTKFTQGSLEKYHQTLIDKVKNNKDKVSNYEDLYFTANSAVMFDKDKDIFFSNTVGDGGNIYNPVGMERGHTYRFAMYDLEDFKTTGLTKEDSERLAKESKNLKGKKLLEMEDQYDYPDGVKRKSYIVLGNEKEMQEKIMNAGNVEYFKQSGYSRAEIKKTTEQAMQDRARRLKDSWYSINSNKGYDSFKTNFDTMTEFRKQYPNGTKEDFLKLMNSNAPETKSQFKHMFTSGNYNKSMIQERVMDFYNLFDDLNENYDMYDTLNKSVQNNTGTFEQFKSSVYEQYSTNAKGEKIEIKRDIPESILKEQYKQMQTATLRESKVNLDNKLIDGVSETDAIRAYYKNNLDIEKNIKLNKALASGENSDVVMKREFQNIFGFEFNKDLDVVRNSILGYKPMQENAVTMAQIDIISPVDGSYTRISGDNSKNIEEGIVGKLNSIRADNGSKEARMIKRNNYINNMGFDLMERGLISRDQLMELRESQNPYSKATLIADYLHEDRAKAESIIKKIATTPNASFGEIVSQKNFDFKNPAASKDETRFLKNYLEQMHKSAVMSTDIVERVAGKSKGAIIKNVIASNEAVNKLGANAKSLIPSIFTNGFMSDFQAKQLEVMFEKEYGWTKDKTKLFLDATVFNKANKDVKNGVSNMIINLNGQGYLVTTNNKRQKRVIDYMIKNGDNIDIEELKKNSMVYKLDKVDDINGIKAIRQGKSSAVALTSDVVPVKNSADEALTFQLRDTLDEALYNLKYRYKNGIEAMTYNNYEKANTVINSARKSINENKRMNGVVVTNLRNSAGEAIGNKSKAIRYSLADYMLKDKYNISGLMGALDGVLKDEKLVESLEGYTDEFTVNRLRDAIKTQQAYPYDKSKRVLFENQSVGTKMWFGQNSTRIAEVLLKDERITDKGLKKMLQKMKDNGVGVMLSKESKEASKGFINAIPAHSYVAGSIYSGASRPLINQVLSSKSIVAADMVDNAKKYGIFDGSLNELSEALDFKTSRSFITKDALHVEHLARQKGDLLSLSTTMKYMSPEEFLNNVNNIQEDKNIANRIANKLGVTSDEVIKAAQDIGTTTSIYEDSGAISPKLARLFEDKTVMVEKDVDDMFSFVKDLESQGKEIIGIDHELNQVTYKNNSKYFDLKLAIGGSEKMVVHTPQIDNAQLDLYEAVFKEISGGANIIGDPNYGKHESFNSMITMYTNAMTRSINSDEDMRVANEILKKNFTVDGKVVHDYKIIKDKQNGYILKEGSRLKDGKINGITAFRNSIEDMKKVKGSFGDLFNARIYDIEHNGIGYVDIATMSDNTIEKSFRWIDGERVGGSKINHRSQQVLGLFIGNDPIKDLSKYRELNNGSIANPLQAIVDADIKEMMSDEKYIMRMQQSSNIGAALSLNSGFDDELVKKAKVQERKLSNIVIGSNRMSATEIPDIFSFSRKEGQRVNAYKINLGNVELDNPYLTDIKQNAEKYAHELGLSSATNKEELINKLKKTYNVTNKINDIYVPSLLPHKVGNDYVLSETQKAAADLITAVKQLNSGEHLGTSREELLAIANEKLSSYYSALRYDLTDKNGLFKKGLSIRAENSARLKVANVIAPVVDKDGRYVSSLLRDTATAVMPDGSVKYVGTQFVNPETLFGEAKDIQASYKNIGKQVLNNEIGNADEVANFLKANSNIKNDTSALGKKYLEEVGIDNILMRDPAMLTTSYQPVRTRIRDNVVTGTTVMDAVTAKFMNADGDGDEVNVFNHILKKNKNGGYEMLDRNSDIYKALDNAITINSDANKDRLRTLGIELSGDKYKASRKGAQTINGYIKQIEALQPEMFKAGNINYIEGQTSINNLLARFLKDSIGQVSNPNYYLKSASTFYHGGMGLNAEALRSQRNIQLLTDITEQSLIDIKSVKGVDQAKAIAKLASSYKENMDILGVKAKSITDKIGYKSQVDAMGDMLQQVGGILEDKSINLLGTDKNLINFNKNILTDDKLRTEMAERILKGNYQRGINGNMNLVSVEEIFGDMFKVLQDDSANSVYWSSIVRQTDVSKLSGESASDIVRAKRALESVGIGENVPYRNPIFKVSGADNYLLNAPMVENTILNVGDKIQSSAVGQGIDPGLYTIQSVSRGADGVRVDFKDMTGRLDSEKPIIRTITGENFDEVSRQISAFELSNKYKTDEEIYKSLEPNIRKGYFDDATSSINGLNKLFNKDLSERTVANHMASKVKDSIHYDNTMDFLSTVEVLKDNKLITNYELTTMRQNMNNALKNKGASTYRDVKKAEMLKLKGIAQRGVSSGSYNAFMNDVFSPEVMNDVKNNYNYKFAQDVMKNNQRYNVDSIAGIINNDLNNIIAESPELTVGRSEQYNKIVDTFKAKDSASLRNVNDLIKETNMDDRMKKEIFNINLEAGVKAINGGEHQKALSMLGKTVITYGDYSGYTIEQLGIEKASEILSDAYMSGHISGIDEKIIEETRNIIKKVSELSQKDDIIKISPNEIAKSNIVSEFGEDYLSNMRKAMNDKIKKKGGSKIRESIAEKTSSMKSALDKAKTGFNNLSAGGKVAVGATAALAAALGVSAISSSGRSTLYDNKDKYDSDGKRKNVKTTEAGTNSTMHQQVPQSDSRFYTTQNTGLGVNVTGDAPSGATSRHSGNMLSAMFGGSDMNISTSFNDSTKPINDSDIDSMMSDATNY